MSDRSKNIALVLGGFCAGFLILEIGLRVVGYDAYLERRFMRFSGPYPSMLKTSWLLAPEQERGDALRIRDRFVSTQKPTDEKRILFLGDSGTYGYGVASRYNFPALYANLLARTAPRARVFNGAVVGFNTCDSIRLYTERLARIQPDTVVLGFFMANDINFNLLCSNRLARHPEWLRRGTGILFERSAFFHFVRRRGYQINAYFRLWTGTPRGDDSATYPAPFALVDDASGLHMLDYRAGEIAGYLPDSLPLMEHAYEVLEEQFTRLKAVTEESGARRLLIVLIPSPSRAVGSFVSPIEPGVLDRLRASTTGLALDDLDVDRPTRRVLAICEAVGVECVDTTRALREFPLGPKYLPRDDHLSARGHAAVAGLLVDVLKSAD
jgi:lysophospholipase L1-like esterase